MYLKPCGHGLNFPHSWTYSELEVSEELSFILWGGVGGERRRGKGRERENKGNEMAFKEETIQHSPHFICPSSVHFHNWRNKTKPKQTLEMHKSSEFIRFFETYFCGCQGPLLGLQPQSNTLLDNLLHMATVFVGWFWDGKFGGIVSHAGVCTHTFGIK